MNLTLFLLSVALAVGFNSLLWKPEVISFYGAKELLFAPNAESSCLERRWKRLHHPARLLPLRRNGYKMKAEKQSALRRMR